MALPAIPHSYTFCRLTFAHLDMVMSWLDAPHMKLTWDNSPAHREDIVCFAGGRQTPSSYFDGIFTYWIGHVDDAPHALLLTAPVCPSDDLPALWKKHLLPQTHTFSIDFGIGEARFLNKGHAGPTLKAFMEFFPTAHQDRVDAFFIDPSTQNPKAAHVYGKAGFEEVGTFVPTEGAFVGDTSRLMIKRL